MNVKGLAYVALAVRDVEATAATFADHMGLTRTDVPLGANGARAPVFSVGASALALFEVGDPFIDEESRPGLHHIALAVPSLNEACETAAMDGVPLAWNEPVAGLDGRRRIRLAPEATAGVKVDFTEPVALPPAAAGMVERIDHIGVASADNRRANDAFVGKLGFPLESTQTDMEVAMAIESFTSDKYGVVYHNRAPRPVGGLRVSFITVGDCEFEFLQNFDPAQDGVVEHGQRGDTRQDQGAITRFVRSRGPGLHHIALKVGDINAALPHLAAAGHQMIDLVGRPGSRRALIGFMHPKSLGGVLMHLVERQAL